MSGMVRVKFKNKILTLNCNERFNESPCIVIVFAILQSITLIRMINVLFYICWHSHLWLYISQYLILTLICQQECENFGRRTTPNLDTTAQFLVVGVMPSLRVWSVKIRSRCALASWRKRRHWSCPVTVKC